MDHCLFSLFLRFWLLSTFRWNCQSAKETPFTLDNSSSTMVFFNSALVSFNKPFVLFSSSSVLFNLSSALLNLIQSKARWVLVADSRWCSISWRWTYMKIYTSFTRNYTYLKLSPYLKQLIWFKVLFDNGFTRSSTNSSESFLLVIFPRTFD